MLGPPQRRPCPATWSELAPYSGGDHVGAEAGAEQGGLQGAYPSPGVDFFNSTELRYVLSESDVPMTMGAEGQTRIWRLSRKAEAEGRSWYR